MTTKYLSSQFALDRCRLCSALNMISINNNIYPSIHPCERGERKLLCIHLVCNHLRMSLIISVTAFFHILSCSLSFFLSRKVSHNLSQYLRLKADCIEIIFRVLFLVIHIHLHISLRTKKEFKTDEFPIIKKTKAEKHFNKPIMTGKT